MYDKFSSLGADVKSDEQQRLVQGLIVVELEDVPSYYVGQILRDLRFGLLVEFLRRFGRRQDAADAGAGPCLAGPGPALRRPLRPGSPQAGRGALADAGRTPVAEGTEVSVVARRVLGGFYRVAFARTGVAGREKARVGQGGAFHRFVPYAETLLAGIVGGARRPIVAGGPIGENGVQTACAWNADV